MSLEKKIKETLKKSWKGVSIRGDPYIQWEATGSFFELWQEAKIEIKKEGYSLFMDPQKGWVVTKFQDGAADYPSYEEYKAEKESTKLEKIRASAISEVGGSRLSNEDIAELIDEISKAPTIDDIYNIIYREANNGEAMWEEIMNNI